MYHIYLHDIKIPVNNHGFRRCLANYAMGRKKSSIFDILVHSYRTGVYFIFLNARTKMTKQYVVYGQNEYDVTMMYQHTSCKYWARLFFTNNAHANHNGATGLGENTKLYLIIVYM